MLATGRRRARRFARPIAPGVRYTSSTVARNAMVGTRLDKDYYAILGVSRAATEDEIRRAYRRQALQWHPDRRPGDPRAAERFREISEAYAVLVNPTRRREYDEASRAGAAGTFRHSQDELFRDLFANPRA